MEDEKKTQSRIYEDIQKPQTVIRNNFILF